RRAHAIRRRSTASPDATSGAICASTGAVLRASSVRALRRSRPHRPIYEHWLCKESRRITSDMASPQWSRDVRTLAITLIATTLVGCRNERRAGDSGAHLHSDSSGTVVQQLQAGRRIGYDAAGRPAPARLEEIVVTGNEWIPVAPADAASSMIIRTATATVEVDSLERAVAQVKELAARLGGYVANSEIEVGKSRQRQGDIEMKVPAMRFEEVLSGLSPIGRLESVNVEAQDVGEEFVDVNARMDNARG